MKRSRPATAADNAAKLFRWMENKVTVPEGVDMMVMALAITLKQLTDDDAKGDKDLDEMIDYICDIIKETVGTLQRIPVDERARRPPARR